MEPVREGLRIQARQQAVVRQHHQALDVMGVTGLFDLLKHRVHAGHAAAATVLQPSRQGVLGLELIALAVGGSEPVVEAMGVLPPPQDLADDPLQTGQRHGAVASGLLQDSNHFQGVEQAEVQIRREQRMPQGGFAVDHGVLIGAKSRQAGVDEVLQHRQGLGAAHPPPEGLQLTGQGWQSALLALLIQLPHARHHRLGDGVGFKPQRLWAPQPFGGGAPVVVVVIPLAPQGLGRRPLTLHQHGKAAPPLPVEQLHAQLAIPIRPGGEGLATPEEGIAGQPIERHRQRQPLNRLSESPIRRFHQPHLLDAVAGDPVAHALPELLANPVVDGPSGLSQLLGEVPHSAPHEHQLLSVIGPLPEHRAALHQQHPCSIGLGTGKGRLGLGQLIPEHPDAEGHAGASPAKRQALRATAKACPRSTGPSSGLSSPWRQSTVTRSH